MTADVLVICINYWNENDTIAYIHELNRQRRSNIRIDIAIVDNSEKATNPDLVAIQLDVRNLSIYGNGTNLGYYGAASYALTRYTSDKVLPEWVIVSNTDISFQTNAFISTLFDLYRESAPEVVAPRFISELTGFDQNPFMLRRPSPLRIHMDRLIYCTMTTARVFITLSLFKNWIRTKMQAGEIRDGDLNQSAPYHIYAPHGSLVIFNREYFNKGGCLDFGSFLFGEELFIAETARLLNMVIQYDPRIIAIHKEHATTSITPQIIRYKHESATYNAKSFFYL